MQEGEPSRIIIRAKFSDYDFLHRIEPYLHFYNNFLHFTKNDMLYLEPIEDSILMIYKDQSAFDRLVRPLPDKSNLDFPIEEKKHGSFIFRAFLPRSKFPANGMTFWFYLVEGSFDALLKRGYEYISWMDPSIEYKPFQDADSKGAKVFFPTYESLMSYTRVLVFKYLMDSSSKAKE